MEKEKEHEAWVGWWRRICEEDGEESEYDQNILYEHFKEIIKIVF